MEKTRNGKTARGATRGVPGAHARKKRTGRGQARAHKPSTPPNREELAALLPLLDMLSRLSPETPLETAEQLVDEALECRSRARREALARQALEVFPDCANAYLLLAMDARGPQAGRPLLEQAIAAAERELGPRYLREEVGSFWLLPETRPYMRAREMLASCLWGMGARQEACAHYQALLRLNPNDNQGIRYLLAASWLEMQEHEALSRLWADYAEDASAAWAYTAALLAFRQNGPTAATEAKLGEALKANAFVPDYLLGRKSLPRQLPDLIGWGDKSEAQEYAAANKAAWAQTRGALDWLRYAEGGKVLSSPPVSSAAEGSADSSPVT